MSEQTAQGEGPFGKTAALDEAECRRLLENAAWEMSTLYYYLAKTFVEAYGEDAKPLVRRAIHDWGEEKGRRQRRNVERLGLEPNLENIRTGSTMPWDMIMEGEAPTFEEGVLKMKCTRCPLADVWREREALDLGILYCDEVDIAKWQAFNEDIDVQRPKAMMRGDDCCEFILRMTR